MKPLHCSCKLFSVLILFLVATASAAPAQILKTLVNFINSNGTEGSEPQALVQYTDGNLYGTTLYDGLSSGDGSGTVFKMTPQGALTTLYAFSGPDGAEPSTLILANDGNFYGTTAAGGANSNPVFCPQNGCGTVFKITPAGSLTTLYSFCAQTNCADGENPQSPLVQGTDGYLYGTTVGGGSQASGTQSYCGYCGTVFKISLSGQLTILYSFCLVDDCPDGVMPRAGLVQGNDGNFYGTTTNGGAGAYCDPNNEPWCGTIFKITPSGQLTTLYSFCSQPGCADGAEQPTGVGLAMDSHGNFYGVTPVGGAYLGTVFEITPAGQFATLYNFCSQPGCADGVNPLAGLVLGSDGNFYGTTSYDGNSTKNGTIFRITPTGTLTTLYSFSNNGDGGTPDAPLVQATTGIFYGSTTSPVQGTVGGTIFSFSLTQLQPTTTTLTSSPNPSNYGQAVTFTATVTAKSGGTPTGTVNFLDGGTTIGSSTLNSSGVATFTTSALLGGTHSMTASYGGDTTFEPSTSPVLNQVVEGATAVLSPTSLNFGSQTLGTTSAPQDVTLTNVGNMTLTISSIGITGTNGNEFAIQTTNCPGALAANASCTIAVTFTPTVEGSASAQLSVTDNAPGSPQSVALSGTVGNSPGVSFSPTNMSFPSQYVGTSGLPQTLTVTNTGNAVLAITNVTSSLADFGTLNNCTNPVQPGTNCTIGVFFDPSASGVRSGNLLITDNATGSPQIVPLTGTGQDFSLTASGSSSATVSPGQTANYTVAIAPGGGFNQTVALSCSGAPAQSTCTLSQNSVSLNGSKSASVTVTVTTAGASASLAHPDGFAGSANRFALWLGLCGLPGLVLLGGQHRRSRQQRARLLRRIALLCFVLVAITWSACGGGNSSSNGSGGNGGTGTPAGTYNLTVTGSFASGSTTLTRTTKLTLVVQ